MKIRFGDYGWVEATPDIEKAIVDGKEIEINFRYDEIEKAITHCVIDKKKEESPEKFLKQMTVHAYKILCNQGAAVGPNRKPRSLHGVISDIELFTSNELDKEALLTDIAQAKGQLDAIASAVEKGNYENAYSIINPAAKYYGKKNNS
tara:strand:- start:9092 stop:9535 length:444 start_codon:yes stop_codon:yes gene_type:complete